MEQNNKKKEMKYQWEHYKIVEKGDRNYIGLGTILYYFKKSVDIDVYKEYIKKLKTEDEDENIDDLQAYKIFVEKYGNRIKIFN